VVVVRTFSTSQWLTLVFASVFLFSLGILVQNVFAESVTVTIPVGNSPGAVATNPVNDKIYVANDGSISVIDGNTNTVTDTIQINYHPSDIKVNTVTNMIYVANFESGSVSVIDGNTNTVLSTISGFGGPFGLGITSKTNLIYVTNFVSNSVSVINGSTNTIVATLSTSGRIPNQVAVNPSTNFVYVSTTFEGIHPFGSIFVINGSTNTGVSNIPVNPSPGHLDANLKTNMIYVANGADGTISVINGTSNSVVNNVSIPVDPTGVGVNPNTNLIYVAGYRDNSTYIIDGINNKITGKISVGHEPFGLAVNPNTNMIYVTNTGDNTVSVIDGSTIPSAPQNLMATAVSTSQINLSWAAPSNDGGSAISGYMIERSTDNGITWSTIVPNTGSTPTVFSDTGLDKKTTYTYRIHAINGAGTSLSSNIVSATTLKNNHLQHHKSI